MKVKTVVLNNNEYLVAKNIEHNGKTYCLLSNVDDVKDILLRKLVSENGNQFFEKVESSEEFYEVLAHLDIESRKQSDEEKFLPVGTVCLLKDATKKVMINGYLVSDGKDGDTLYDYSAVLFPSGNNIKLAFNHEQIDKIIHMGYNDDESTAFIQELNSLEPVIRMIFNDRKTEVEQNG